MHTPDRCAELHESAKIAYNTDRVFILGRLVVNGRWAEGRWAEIGVFSDLIRLVANDPQVPHDVLREHLRKRPDGQWALRLLPKFLAHLPRIKRDYRLTRQSYVMALAA